MHLLSESRTLTAKEADGVDEEQLDDLEWQADAFSRGRRQKHVYFCAQSDCSLRVLTETEQGCLDDSCCALLQLFEKLRLIDAFVREQILQGALEWNEGNHGPLSVHDFRHIVLITLLGNDVAAEQASWIDEFFCDDQDKQVH